MPKGALYLTGDRELDRILRTLPFRLQGRAMNNALKAAAEPVRDDTRDRFPKDTGWTAKRFRIKTTKPTPDGKRSAKIGVFLAANKGKRKFATARGIEFGTADQPGKFPLRRSLAAKRQTVASTIGKHLAIEIPKAAAELKATR